VPVQMFDELPWTAPIRQCHVFRETRETDAPIVGMVVTSDCDIAQDKFRGTLTWVPVVPARSYIASLWMNDQLDGLAREVRAALIATVQAHREKRELPAFTETALADWASSVSEGTLLVPFECGAERDAANRLQTKLSPHVAALQNYRELRSGSVPERTEVWPADTIAATVATFWALRDAKTPNGGRKNVIGEIRKAILSPAGSDIFPVHDVPGLTPGIHVVLLRFLREMSIADLVGSLAQAIDDERRFYRLASLRPPYKYGLTRRLASVFSDIGLPEDYEQHSREAADAVANLLAGGT
jgi:hypothetical protein